MVQNEDRDGDYQHHETMNITIVEWNETLQYVKDELVVQDNARPFSAPPAENVHHNANEHQADYGAFDVVLPFFDEVPINFRVQFPAIESFLPVCNAQQWIDYSTESCN